jgi:hypothetical protein
MLDHPVAGSYAPRVEKGKRTQFAIALGTCAIACGGSVGLPPDTVRLQQGERSEVDRFFPLHDGVVYEYDTRGSSGRPGIMTIQVENTDAQHVEMAFGGRRESLVVSATGARYADGGYLLKAPLTLDNSWDGRHGVARVVERNVELTVPAGNFVGCIRVQENDRSHTSTTTTSVYCPKVGLVLLDVKTSVSHETASLRRFGPRIDPLIGETPAVAED